MALHTTLNTKSFLKSPGQELSESVVLFNGTQKFARLDFREVWHPQSHRDRVSCGKNHNIVQWIGVRIFYIPIYESSPCP